LIVCAATVNDSHWPVTSSTALLNRMNYIFSHIATKLVCNVEYICKLHSSGRVLGWLL